MGNILNALNQACMSAVNAGKSLLDCYGSLVTAVLAAVGELGNLGKVGVAISVAGAITIGGMGAGNTTQPGQILGKPEAPVSSPTAPATGPAVDSIAGNLPGQITIVLTGNF